MNYIAYTARFLYRIKWWLILAPIIVALAVFFKMGAQPRNYKSMTTVYTGIVSGYDIPPPKARVRTGTSSTTRWTT